MRCFREVHYYESDCGCEGSGEPLERGVGVALKVKLENGSDDDAGEAGEEVAEY
jgi:hypothetical protein